MHGLIQDAARHLSRSDLEVTKFIRSWCRTSPFNDSDRGIFGEGMANKESNDSGTGEFSSRGQFIYCGRGLFPEVYEDRARAWWLFHLWYEKRWRTTKSTIKTETSTKHLRISFVYRNIGCTLLHHQGGKTTKSLSEEQCIYMIQQQMTNSHKGESLDLGSFDPNQTVPISLRVPVKIAYLITLYSERMNTSTGKFLSSVLEDVMPAFSNPPKDGMVRIRIPSVYQAMQHGDLLQNVRPEDVKSRILHRGEGQPTGRPTKRRKPAEEG